MGFPCISPSGGVANGRWSSVDEQAAEWSGRLLPKVARVTMDIVNVVRYLFKERKKSPNSRCVARCVAAPLEVD